MVKVKHVSADGRFWAVLVPEGHEDEAAYGVQLGPPDLSSLGLPEAQAVRLHNELYNRGILSERDARRRTAEVAAALAAALRVDVQAIMALYRGS